MSSLSELVFSGTDSLVQLAIDDAQRAGYLPHDTVSFVRLAFAALLMLRFCPVQEYDNTQAAGQAMFDAMNWAEFCNATAEPSALSFSA